MKYIHFEQDGVRQAFPVSRHVLRVGAPLQAMRAWRPSLLQQGASFALMLALSASSYGITYGHLDNTLAYFRDYEVSEGNMLAAAALFFDLNPGTVTERIERGGTVPISMLMTPGDETAPLMYRVTAEEPAELAGAQPLCALLTASGTTPFMYSGPLLGIATEPTTTPGRWNVDISLAEADGLFDGSECTVHFVYRAWHKDSPEGTGYTDEKFDSFTFVYGAPEVLEAAPNALLMEMEMNGEAKDAPHEPEEPSEVPEESEQTPSGGGGGGGGGTTEPPAEPETPTEPEETLPEPEEPVEVPEATEPDETPEPEQASEEETPAEEPAQEETPPVETPPEPEPTPPPAEPEQTPVEVSEE